MHGGIISFQDLGNGKILVTGKVLRDCRGIAFNNPSFSVFAGKNGDQSCGTYTLSFSRIEMRTITEVCSTAKDPCFPQNTGNTGEGVEMHVFQAILDITQAPLKYFWGNTSCPDITFAMGQCCRNGAITTGSAGNDFWVTTTLNWMNLSRCKNSRNNSPVISRFNNLFQCCGQPSFYNPGFKDSLEGDSLTYRKAWPISVLPAKGISYSTPFSFQFPVTPYCPTIGQINCTPNPGTGNPVGYYVDTVTGQMIFIPVKCDEVTVVGLEVLEWRKDTTGKYVQISRTLLDQNIIVKDDCGFNNVPVISAPVHHHVLSGEKYCFEIKTSDKTHALSPVKDTTILTWNKGIPDATFTINDLKARERTATFCWQTDSSHIRQNAYHFAVYVSDQHCPKPTLASLGFTIKVKPPTKASINITALYCNQYLLNATIEKGTRKKYFWNLTDSSGRIVFSSQTDSAVTQPLKPGRYIVKFSGSTLEYGFKTVYDSIIVSNPLPSGLLKSSASSVCFGNKADISADIKNSQSPWAYAWNVNGLNVGADSTSVLHLFNIEKPQNINLKVTDAHGCKIDFKSLMIDTFPKPVVQWNSAYLPEQCRNNPAVSINEFLISPPVFLRKESDFNITGSSASLGVRGLIDSAGPVSFYINPSKLDNKLLQNGHFHSETITAWYRDSNGCEASAQVIQLVKGNPEFLLKSPQYCQNQFFFISTDSFLNSVNRDTFSYKWSCTNAPFSVVPGTVIQTDQFDRARMHFGITGDNKFAGEYDLKACVSDKFSGCSSCLNTTVTLLPQPNLSLSPKFESCGSANLYDLGKSYLNNGLAPNTNNARFIISSLDGDTSKSNMNGASIVNQHYFALNNMPGDWKFRVTQSEKGCSASVDFLVRLIPRPESKFKTLGGDTANILQPSFNVANLSTIKPYSQLNYFWTFDMRFPDVINSTDFNPVISYLQRDEVYQVRLISKSNKNCSDTFYKTLVVGEGSAGKTDLYAESVKLNNEFVYSGNAQFVSISIFDLSGRMVYSSKMNQGTKLKPGQYLYQLTLNYAGKLYYRQGKKTIESE